MLLSQWSERLQASRWMVDKCGYVGFLQSEFVGGN